MRRDELASQRPTPAAMLGAAILALSLVATPGFAEPPAPFPYEPRLRSHTPSASAGPLSAPPGASPLELAALTRAGVIAVPASGSLLETTIEVALADGAALVTADLACDVAWLELHRLWRRIEVEVLAPELDALACGVRDALGQRDSGDPALEPAREIAAAYAELLLAVGPSRIAPREPRAIAALAAFARGEAVTELSDRPLLPPADALDLAGALLGRPDQAVGRVDPEDPRWLAALLVTRTIFAQPELARRWERLSALVASAVGGHPSGDLRPVARRLLSRGGTALTGPDGASRSVLAALDQADLAAAIALLGPRHVADHDWLARVSYPHAGTPAVPRTDPGGLDLAAALGCPLALAELVALDSQWPGVREAILALAIERLPTPRRVAGRPADPPIDSAYAAGLDVAASMLRSTPPTDGYAREAWQARCAAFSVGTWLRMRSPPATPRALAAPDARLKYRVEPVPAVFARIEALAVAARTTWFSSLPRSGVRDDVQRSLGELAGALAVLVERAAEATRADPARDAGVARIVEAWCARAIHPPRGPEPWVVLARARDTEGRVRAVRARLSGALVGSFVLSASARRVALRGAIYAHVERAANALDPEPTPATGDPPAWILRHLTPGETR